MICSCKNYKYFFCTISSIEISPVTIVRDTYNYNDNCDDLGFVQDGQKPFAKLMLKLV